MNANIISYKEEKRQNEKLLNYFKDIVEPTLSMAWRFYLQGKMTKEAYIMFVSCLTETFEEYDKETERFLDACWENYGELLPTYKCQP